MCTAGLNAAGEIASEAIADASTWDGPVQVQQSDRIPVSAFAEQLQYEPEQEPPERESFPAEISEVTQLLTRPPPIKQAHSHAPIEPVHGLPLCLPSQTWLLSLPLCQNP